MLSVDQGRAAEHEVAQHLKNKGYKILARNWKTTKCEIDVIAEKDGVAYLVEVKYRSKEYQGTGFDYITPKKQKQMLYAAEVWAHENNWAGDMRLVAAEVCPKGKRYIVTFAELEQPI